MLRYEAKAERADALTPRQRHILDLMRASRSHPEGVGNVQVGAGASGQHVVALFNRLHESHRAPAGRSKFGPAANQVNPVADGLLQRRPCLILCVSLPNNAPVRLVRRLHTCLASLAYQHDALFLARKGNAGDLIFGLHKASEYDVLKALQVLQALQLKLSEDEGLAMADQASEPTANLRAALVAGLLVASMHRFGGWSGEAVASAYIGRGRALLRQAESGQLAMSEQVTQLLYATGMATAQVIPAMLPLKQLSSLRWHGERPSGSLRGREQEWTTLASTLAAMPHRISQQLPCQQLYLCGEKGMGKSFLCRQFAQMCQRKGQPVRFWRCMPSLVGAPLRDVISGAEVTFAQWLGMTHGNGLLIVDDVDFLPLEQQRQLIACARQQCAVLLLASRRMAHSLTVHDQLISLARLPQVALEAIIQDVWGVQQPGKFAPSFAHAGSGEDGPRTVKNSSPESSASSHCMALAKVAAGVPLFAIELARHNRPPATRTNINAEWAISFALATVVSARLDELALDRCVLQQIAHFEEGCNEAQLTLAMASAEESAVSVDWPTSVEHACVAGVLQQFAKDGLLHWQISHPLLRRVLVLLAQDNLH